METGSLLEGIIKELQLGAVNAPPHRVTGGYMHKMYQLETTTGKYAVKLLNPVIMKRPDVFRNYQRAEHLETILFENEIPIIPAMKINGRKMQCINKQYYYIFPWSEGKALGWEEIKEEHCRIAGRLLAKIHKIEQVEKPFIRDKIDVNWDAYIERANAKCPEIAEELIINRELFLYAQEEFNTALSNIPALTCICDGDMDSKNVLWLEGKPVIIDLESLDYGNPCLEMFQLALGWSGDTQCAVDYGFLRTFISSYQEENGRFHGDWKALYGIGFGWLEWLSYNIKRALLIECENEEERQLGIGQVHETIRRIGYYHSVKEELLEQLSRIAR